ncbi:MAG TPA: D-aminoacyl-tRNA deacylase [Pseudogracilibacillus sp.]|nr:D-aminoacyl-tRNA deacylase [Pseudogracilibacillus sp.]
MKAVIQRTKQSHVTVEGKVIGQIDQGFTILLGVTHEDTKEDVDTLVRKIINLRIFEDENGKMNLSLKDINGSVLSVSQFTLYGNVKKGNRPSFAHAAKPDQARDLYDYFNEQLQAAGIEVETGQFGAMMHVAIDNDGPVTIIMETKAGKIIE